MAGFRTEREQTKWNALQHAAGTSIDKVLAGAATPTDLKILSSLLKQQHEVAGKIFDSGIEDAQKTADTIVDRINSDRVAVGKNPLSAKAHERIFQRTFQNVLKEAIEDILGSVMDELDGQLGDHQDALESAFEKIRRFTQQRLDSPQPTPDRTAPSGSLSRVWRPRALTNTNPAGGTSDTGVPPTVPFQDQEREPVWRRIGQFARNKALPAVKGLGSTAVQSIVSTASKAKSTLADVMKWVRRPTADEDDEEDKRQNSWLRKLSSFLGPLKHMKGKGGGLASTLMKGLALTLMNPQLIKTITDQIRKYLNFDTISSFLTSTWKDVEAGGANVVKWIIDKVKSFFGFGNTDAKAKAVPKTNADYAEINASVVKNSTIPRNTTVNDAKAAIPDLQEKIQATKVSLTKITQKNRIAPSDDTRVGVSHTKQRLAILQNQLAQYEAKVSGKPAPPMVMPFTTTPALQPTGKGTAGGSIGTTMASGVSVPPVAVVPPKSITQVVPVDKPTFKEGVTLEPNKQENEGTKAKGGGAAASGQVSMSSFGFNSGDDTLNLLNLGVIS